MKVRQWPGSLALIGMGALALRLIYLAELHDSPLFSVLIGDGRQYDSWAQQIAAGHWIGSEIFYQTPLYPYLLAVVFKLLGHHLFAVRVMQAGLGAMSCVFLSLAGRRFFSQRAGSIAGLLLAIYPPAVFFDGLIQKSSLDLFLITLILAVLGEFFSRPHWKWLVAAGAAMGAFMLNRENARVLYPILAVWLLIWFRRTPFKSRMAWAAIFTVSVAAVLLPVGLRNYHVGGEFLLSTSQFGSNFYIGNHAGAQGAYEALVPDHGNAAYERSDATRLAQEAMGRKLSPGEVSNYWLNRSVDYIRSQLWNWLALMGRKLLLTLGAAEVVDTESIEVYSEYARILRVLFWINFGLILPLAVFGAWQTRADWRRLAVLHAMFVGLTFSVAIFYASARYRYPIVPIGLLFAAAALSALPSVRGDWRRQWVPGLLLAFPVAVVSNLPMIPCYDDTRLNLGAELIRSGRPAEAIPPLQRAIEVSPDYAPLYFNLGVAFNQTGDKQRAVEEFSAAIQRRSEYAEAHGALALTLHEMGRTKEAFSHFGEAARLKPDSAEAQCNLGLALAEAGQRQEAIVHYREALRLKPDDLAARINLAGVLQQEGKGQEAIANYEVVLKLKPDYAEAHSNLALVLKESGNYSAAIEHFKEALRLQPNNFGIRINFGDLLSGLGRTKEAIEQYEQAARLSPDDPNAYYLLAQAYAQSGRWNEALAGLEKALAAAQAAGQSDAARVITEAIHSCKSRMARQKP